jgi:hypothetical protein
LTPRITLDRYVYEDIYPAFKATTDEKEITAKLNRTFLNHLARQNLIVAKDSPVTVADIGCGPCDTLVKYLTGVHCPAGYVVRATDYLPEYADAQRGQALQILADAQAKKAIKLIEFSTRSGNAFGGDLLSLLSGPHDGTKMRRAFDLVFASHVFYHAETLSDVERLLADVAENILGRDGVCIMFHLANTPLTFQDFRARFGSQAGAATQSDTGAVTIDDPPAQIATACGGLGLRLFEKEFTTSLRFGPLGDAEWKAFKDPQSYDAVAESNSGAYEDLKRLYFVVQRAALEFVADGSRTGLITYIDEIRAVIEANHGVLPSSERMQVFGRAGAASRLLEAIPTALAAASSDIAGA